MHTAPSRTTMGVVGTGDVEGEDGSIIEGLAGVLNERERLLQHQRDENEWVDAAGSGGNGSAARTDFTPLSDDVDSSVRQQEQQMQYEQYRQQSQQALSGWRHELEPCNNLGSSSTLTVRGTYSRLYDGIEFDRGSRFTRFKKSSKRKCSRLLDRVVAWLVEFLRSTGFMVDEVDVIRASQYQQQQQQQGMQLRDNSGFPINRGQLYRTMSMGAVSGTGDEGEEELTKDVVFWHNLKLGLAALALVFVTALEPILLKVMSHHAIVDEHRDYRYVLSQLLTLCHLPLALVSGIWYAVKYSLTAVESCNFPKSWLVILAFLNALHMIMVVVPCGDVPGTLTVLLVHTSIPIGRILSLMATVFMLCVEYWFPSFPTEPEFQPSTTDVMLHNQYGGNRPGGSTGSSSWYYARAVGQFALSSRSSLISFCCISFGAAVAMIPVFSHDALALGESSACYTYSTTCKSSTLTFLLAALPACMSSICLERTLVSYSVPLSPLLLHAWLLPMQFVFGVLLAPVGRHFQHPAQPLHNISHELIGMNTELSEGLKCIFAGKESGTGLIDHADPNWCKPLLPLLVLFVAVSFSFHILTLYVIKYGTELCLRVCTAVAIPFAWSVLVIYDMDFQQVVGPDVPTQIAVSWFSKVSVVVVVVGVLFHNTIDAPATSFVLTSPFEEQDCRLIESQSEVHRMRLMEAKARSDHVSGTERNFGEQGEFAQQQMSGED